MENFKDEIYLAMLERTIKRLWIMSLILIILLVGSNIAWLYYESQFEDVTTTSTTIDADAKDGGNATGIIGNDNEVSDHGKSKSN